MPGSACVSSPPKADRHGSLPNQLPRSRPDTDVIEYINSNTPSGLRESASSSTFPAYPK